MYQIHALRIDMKSSIRFSGYQHSFIHINEVQRLYTVSNWIHHNQKFNDKPRECVKHFDKKCDMANVTYNSILDGSQTYNVV